MSRNLVRPKVTLNCVADHYSMSKERIIEFTFPDGSGGLIQFYGSETGENRIVIYNHDVSVKVIEGKHF
jgi:hypothetical protein